MPCPPTPVHGQVTATDPAGHVSGTATTDQTGRYAISLPPGRYTVSVSSGGPFPRCPDTPVVVSAGPPTTGDIRCDTGIR